MSFTLTPTGSACGAVVAGLDLSRPLADATVADLRRSWLDHHVLVFPRQSLRPDDLIRVAEYFGAIGDDPYIEAEPGLGPIAAIQRRASETGSVFADIWHADWTFMPVPPAATMLYGITIPPRGGDTLFASEHLALDAMPADLRARIEGRVGLHSARGGYGPSGIYAEDKFDGAMRIRTSEDAKAIQRHPLIRTHPETGRPGLFVGSYVIGIDGLPRDESRALLAELAAWVDREDFRYSHKWEAGALVIWDNRSVLHRATGGYEGHDRYLQRLTISDDPSRYAPPPPTDQTQPGV